MNEVPLHWTPRRSWNPGCNGAFPSPFDSLEERCSPRQKSKVGTSQANALPLLTLGNRGIRTSARGRRSAGFVHWKLNHWVVLLGRFFFETSTLHQRPSKGS